MKQLKEVNNRGLFMDSLFTELYNSYKNYDVSKLDDILNNVGITIYDDRISKNNDPYGEWEVLNKINNEFIRNGYDVPLLFSTSSTPEDFIKKIFNYRPSIIINLYDSINDKNILDINTCFIFDFLGIPYTGGNSFASIVSTNKAFAKSIMIQYGIPTPRFKEVTKKDKIGVSNFNFPLFVKPSCADASDGIDKKSFISNDKELEIKLEELFLKFDRVLIEEFINGNEYFVGIIGNGDNIEILPIYETDLSSLSIDNKIMTQKYKEDKDKLMNGKVKINCPAKISRDLEKNLKNYALKVYDIFKLRDYARFDFKISNKGNIFLLEVNNNPDISGFMKMVECDNHSLWYFIKLIISEAIKRSK
jgi:D-alanine-D-alanine ligase